MKIAILITGMFALIAATIYAVQPSDEPPLAIEMNVQEGFVQVILVNKGDQPSWFRRQGWGWTVGAAALMRWCLR